MRTELQHEEDDTLGQIRAAMNDALSRGITQADMAKATGIPQSTISKIRTGSRNSLNGPKWVTLISFLSQVTDLPLPYVAKGLLGVSKQTELAANCHFIPLRKSDDRYGGDNAYFPLRREQVYRIGSPLSKLTFVHARGDAMYPVIQEGSAVVIDESDIIPENNKIYYIQFQNRYLIRRLEVDERGNVVALVSDNGPVRCELLDGEVVEVIGRCRVQLGEL